jgi:hypothetical protein
LTIFFLAEVMDLRSLTAVAFAALVCSAGCATSPESKTTIPVSAQAGRFVSQASHLRLEPKSISLLGVVLENSRHSCPHKQDKDSVCLTDDNPPISVAVQESDGYRGPFTFAVANPSIAAPINYGYGMINVDGLAVGGTTISVTGDKGASANLKVEVSETDIYLVFSKQPANAVSFEISDNLGGPGYLQQFPESGPLKYHFSIYDYPLPIVTRQGGMFTLTVFDASMVIVYQRTYPIPITTEGQDNSISIKD